MAAKQTLSASKIILRSKMCAIKQSQWQCRYCLKTYTEKHDATYHEKSKHPDQYQPRPDTKPKPFKCTCPGCSYSGPSAGALNKHTYDAHHTTIQDKTCRYCGDVFTNKHSRIRHEQSKHDSMQNTVSLIHQNAKFNLAFSRSAHVSIKIFTCPQKHFVAHRET